MKNKLYLAVLVFIIFSSKLAFSDDILKGFDAYKDKDYKRAFEIWHKLAEEGDPIAQNSLGVLFQKGRVDELEKLYISLNKNSSATKPHKAILLLFPDN